jgi:membrane protease YdiL (CAAX protease family)
MNLLSELFVMSVVAGSCAGWVLAFRRIKRKQPVLARVQRTPAPWGLLDLLLATVLMITFQLVNAFVLTKELGIDPTRGWDRLSLSDLALVLWCEPAVNLVAITIALTAIGLRTKARLSDFGVSLGQVRQDLWLGTVAFVMLAPLVYGLQRILTIWFPYDHPLISVLQKHPQPILHAAVFFSAVVAAPIVEEFFYRILWQGWLQAFAGWRSDFVQLVLGNPVAPVPVPDDRHIADSKSGGAAAPPQAFSAEVLAILASSALFASMHISQGAAPIPLFVLALGLGYLVARTGRVLPCIVVHVLLNACSLAMLWISPSTGSGP